MKHPRDTQAKQGSSSFLKKRTKKLLLVASSSLGHCVASLFRHRRKSFLVLFFKKELLPLPSFASEPLA
jgi:hypothetical protein